VQEVLQIEELDDEVLKNSEKVEKSVDGRFKKSLNEVKQQFSKNNHKLVV